jgi:pyridinium-3,5-biscarboxylic acid mononucleotide sulfurtransferase
MASLVALLDVTALDLKEQRLLAVLRSLERVLVAYSGGTDSAYLAWAAHRALGENAIAITADSVSIPDAASNAFWSRMAASKRRSRNARAIAQ